MTPGASTAGRGGGRRSTIHRSPALVLLAWLLSAVPMGVQLRHLKYLADTGPKVGLVTLAALALVVLVPRWPVMILSAVGAAFVAHRIDPLLRVGTVGTIVVLPAAWCAALGALQPSSWKPLRPLLVGAVPPLLIADVLLLGFSSLKVPIVLIVAAVGSMASTVWKAGLIAPRLVTADRPGRLVRLAKANQRFLDRIGRPIGVAAGFLGMLPGAALLAVAWVAQQATRFDLLAPPVVDGTRWVRRSDLDSDPGASYVPMTVADPRGAGRTAHRWLSASLVAALVAGLGWVTLGPEPAPPPPPPPGPCVESPTKDVDPAMDQDPGWPLIGCLTTQLSQRAHFDAVTTYSFDDYSSKYVNLEDGVRPTWRPPPCDCRRITVWWFGGSAAWGWYQRDDYTPASQFAKAAWEEGIALDITNYAMPGWVLGQGVQRFASLSSAVPPPDVAVFYDGGNDLSRQMARNGVGVGDDASGTSAAEFEINDLLAQGPFDWSSDGDDGPGSEEGDRRLGPRAVARAAMDRYGRGVRTGTAFAGAAGTEPIFVFQPLLGFAPRRIGNPNALGETDWDDFEEMRPVVAAEMPKAVVDLTGVLDDARRPVFKDLFHTNEYAADTVAKALFERVRPRVAAISAASPVLDPTEASSDDD